MESHCFIGQQELHLTVIFLTVVFLLLLILKDIMPWFRNGFQKQKSLIVQLIQQRMKQQLNL